MKIKQILPTAALSLIMSAQGYSSDIYRINNYNTLITATRAELETFMYLSRNGQKSAVRALYNNLQANGSLFNVQPGTYVEVTYYYNDGIAKIEWGDNYAGYIAKGDLSEFPGSR